MRRLLAILALSASALAQDAGWIAHLDIVTTAPTPGAACDSIYEIDLDVVNGALWGCPASKQWGSSPLIKNSTLPTGTTLMISSGTCPTGFTEVSALSGK